LTLHIDDGIRILFVHVTEMRPITKQQ